jgi:hypothetical protein
VRDQVAHSHKIKGKIGTTDFTNLTPTATNDNKNALEAP